MKLLETICWLIVGLIAGIFITLIVYTPEIIIVEKPIPSTIELEECYNTVEETNEILDRCFDWYDDYGDMVDELLDELDYNYKEYEYEEFPICSYNAYDCSDDIAGQYLYDWCLFKVGYDVHHLDGDFDGLACEPWSSKWKY